MSPEAIRAIEHDCARLIARYANLNDAGRWAEVAELYADAPGAPRGPDRLGRTVLGVGETVDFAPPEGIPCRADLTAVFRDGREVTLPAIDLCAGVEVVVQ